MENGGYRSEYDPITKRYASWGGGTDCTLSTSGVVLALLKSGTSRHLALKSGECLLDITIRKPGSPLDGAIPSGHDSNVINSYYLGIAIQALCALYEITEDERFIERAIRAGKYVIECLQDRVGSIRSYVLLRPNLWNRIRYLSTETQTWLAEYARTFLLLHSLTRERIWVKATARLVRWLLLCQNSDGSLSKAEISPLGRFLYAARNINPRPIIDGWDKRVHPTSQTASLNAFLLGDHISQGVRIHQWLRNGVSTSGLLYENYPVSKKHPVLDVMPSAQYGITLLRHEENLSGARTLTDRIAAGIMCAMISSEDKNADGGMRGLPGDRKKGSIAFTWDTAYSIMFLLELLRSQEC